VTLDFAARLFAHMTHFDLVGIAGTTRLIGPSWVHAGWPHTHGQVGYRSKTAGHIDAWMWQMREAATAGAEALDGVFLAARREVLAHVAFDERTFDGWHLYDIDFTYAAHLAGFRLGICHDVCLIHESGGAFGADWRHYAQRFMDKYRGRFPPFDALQAQDTCSIEANSTAEWLLMTEAITARPGS
jgi:hypothetical protein